MKQDCIKITIQLLVPYEPNTFGDTHRAEQLASDVKADLGREGIVVDVFRAKKTRVSME